MGSEAAEGRNEGRLLIKSLSLLILLSSVILTIGPSVACETSQNHVYSNKLAISS